MSGFLHTMVGGTCAFPTSGARHLPREFCRMQGPRTDVNYIVTSNFPDPESDTGFLVAARSRVRFTEVFENMYTGNRSQLR